MRTLTTALAKKGHNITSLSPDIDKVKTENLHYLHLDKLYESIFSGTTEVDFIELGKISVWWSMYEYFDHYDKLCEGAITSTGYKQLLDYPDDFKFDLVIHDFITQPTLLGFLHKFNYPPLVGATAFNGIGFSFNVAGSMIYPHIPFYFSKNKVDTFIQRTENYLLHFYDMFIKKQLVYPNVQKKLDKLFPGLPDLRELDKKTKLVLFNFHPVVNVIEPLLPNVIAVGGLQIQEPKDLPAVSIHILFLFRDGNYYKNYFLFFKDLKELADSAKKGLILFSLGTNVRSDMLGKERIISIIEGFRKLPDYLFFWKFESKELPVEVPKNVIIRPWIPQNDVLGK